jgi:hypothetical protein
MHQTELPDKEGKSVSEFVSGFLRSGECSNAKNNLSQEIRYILM